MVHFRQFNKILIFLLKLRRLSRPKIFFNFGTTFCMIKLIITHSVKAKLIFYRLLFLKHFWLREYGLKLRDLRKILNVWLCGLRSLKWPLWFWLFNLYRMRNFLNIFFPSRGRQRPLTLNTLNSRRFCRFLVHWLLKLVRLHIPLRKIILLLLDIFLIL